MKPLSFAFSWAIFFASFIAFSFVTELFLSITSFGNALKSTPPYSEEFTQPWALELIILAVSLTASLAFTLWRFPASRKPSGNTTSQIAGLLEPAALWLLYLGSYVGLYVIISDRIESIWQRELLINTYAVMSTASWDLIHEGILVLLPLVANMAFIYLTMTGASQLRRMNSPLSKDHRP